MALYQFDKEKYFWLKENWDKVDWIEFAVGRDNFTDYHSIANPYLDKEHEDYLYWKEKFDKIFEKDCRFDYIVRLINSFMITGEQNIEKNI